MNSESPEVSSCAHPIHGLLRHFPNIWNVRCKRVNFYKITKDHQVTRMCCGCYNRHKLETKGELIICHWVTFGNVEFSSCQYCGTTVECDRSIFECSQCTYAYFERALYEKERGQDINSIQAFAFCITHKQGIIAQDVH